MMIISDHKTHDRPIRESSAASRVSLRRRGLFAALSSAQSGYLAGGGSHGVQGDGVHGRAFWLFATKNWVIFTLWL
jgi:hypothetical protein